MFSQRSVTALVITTLTCTALSQQFATYDPAAAPAAEFAASSCPPAPAMPYADDLISFPPSAAWWHGATAADNVNSSLYYCTGWPADGIQQVPFKDIGSGFAPTNYPAPAGMNQITGMIVDPRFPAGNQLIITDGFVIIEYDVTTATTGMTWPAPVPAGMFLTGLAYDPFTNSLYTVNNNAQMRRRTLAGGAWSPPIFPSVAVPANPTGISFCKTAPGTPFLSFFGGVVMNPATGAVIPFAPSPTGMRHHRGLTLISKATILGGSGGPPVWVPNIEIANGFVSGTSSTQVVVDAANVTILAIDLAPTLGLAVPVPGFSGLARINPATSITIALPPGTHTIPLGLVGVPPGIGITFQAAGWNGGGWTLSDAHYLQTHL